MIFSFNTVLKDTSLKKRYTHKMNETVNKFLLAGDKFIPEMHLKQPGFTYSACGQFIKNKERIQNSKNMRYKLNLQK